MKKITFLRIMIFAVCIFQILSAVPGESIRGIVYCDLNGNNAKEPEEQGIPGVLVSNGLDVTATDAKGKYELNIFGDTVIFITKPDGYTAPCKYPNLPFFYYIHRPTGSPSMRYKGIDPTNPLPESLDFPLVKSKTKSEFDVLVFADTQPASPERLNYLRDDVISGLVGSKASFGIVLGDIVSNRLSLYDDYKELISKVGIPFYHVAGNHDTNQDFNDDRYSMETFTRHFGPPYYSFDFGQVHFVALDNIDWLGIQNGRGRYQPKLGEKQMKWLKNDLKHVDPSKLVVLCTHIPMKNVFDDHSFALLKDIKDLFTILEDRKNILFIAGHTHTLRHLYLNQKDGWNGAKPIHQITCGTVCGCWWGGPKDVDGLPVSDMSDGTPNGYHLFRFKGNTYSEKYIPARLDDDFQMRISSPPVEIMRDEIPDYPIIVNIFNGSEKSQVECRVDDSFTTGMARIIRTDPYMEKMITDNQDIFSSSFRPRISYHIWVTSLPQDLKEGLHTIRIKTIDQYGQVFHGSKVFKIE